MRVLVVCSGNAVQGISPLVKAQIDSLIQIGTETAVFAIDKPGFSGYIKAISSLRKRIKISKPDIIHAHYGLSGLVVFLSFTGCKVVISFMGDDLIGSVGKDQRYTLFSKVLVLINKTLAKRYYDYSITKSGELDKIISKTKNKTILPNGVNLNVFYPYDIDICRDRLGIDKDEKIVLFAADPSRPEKNYALAVTALTLLNNNKIRIIPVFSEEHIRLHYYYNAADVLLLTSIHEGSPNVIKEAMACCCPIVTTNVGDVKEILGTTAGCYIAESSSQSVAEYLLKAIEFRKTNLFTEGRDRLVDLNLDSESVAKKLVGIYRKVI